MRALFVNHTGRISGGELSLIGMLEAMPAKVQASVACPEGPLAHRLRDRGVEVLVIHGTDGSLRLHPIRTPQALAQMGRASLQVRIAAAQVKADLVHANSIRAGIIATAALPGRSRPTVVHVRDCLPSGTLSGLTLRAISRADALIANSTYTKSTLGPAKARARVVHNAVDLSRFDRLRLSRADARARLGLGEGQPILAVVAQITPWKGQMDAIAIANTLLRSHPDLHLLLVGSPKFDSAATRYDNTAYFELLRQRVLDLGLMDSVHFLGERDDVPEILRAVDLLLVPSWEEPFGRAIIEAMASGVPVAATNVGGPPEILGEPECGLLLPPREPRIWADAIGRLLGDPAQLQTMGERGQAAARSRFCVKSHVNEIVALYESVIGADAA